MVLRHAPGGHPTMRVKTCAKACVKRLRSAKPRTSAISTRLTVPRSNTRARSTRRSMSRRWGAVSTVCRKARMKGSPTRSLASATATLSLPRLPWWCRVVAAPRPAAAFCRRPLRDLRVRGFRAAGVLGILDRGSHQRTRRPGRDVLGLFLAQRANVARHYECFPSDDHGERRDQALESSLAERMSCRSERSLYPLHPAVTAHGLSRVRRAALAIHRQPNQGASLLLGRHEELLHRSRA